jgi:hypothetical protein
MYQEKKEIVLFGVDSKPLKPFVPEIKIRMNKGKIFDVNKVTTSREVYEILKRIFGRNPIQENFVMLLFNRANKLVGYYKHTIGSTSATIVDIPMLIGLATKALAQGIVISHNHPSGTLSPSDPDRELTRNISQALKTVKINLLDHLIYTNDGYYSFADEGTLNGLNNIAMITVENIISEYPGIDQAILPDALKKDEFEFIQENIDLYNDDETIKKYIDTFVEKLNEFAAKGKVKSKTKLSQEKDEHLKLKASDIPAIVKKFMPKFQQQVIIGSEEHFDIVKRLELEIKAIPKDTREADKAYEKANKNQKVNYLDFYTVYAHFFLGGSDWYVLSWDGDDMLFCYVVLNGDTQMSEMGDVALSELHENRIELDFFWDIKPLSKALYESFPDEFPEPVAEIKSENQPRKNTMKKSQEQQTDENEPKPTQVERVDLEVSFVKRYVGLHGKTKDKAQILNLLNSLQKAIIEKRIRKTSVYAKEIENIQEQLIKCYNQMGNTIKVTLNENTLDSYSAISQSQKAMLSVTYIKQYITIHGKKDVKEKAKSLLNRIEKAIETGKIPENCPYWNEIQEIKSSLESYLVNKYKTPVISENTLNGIMSWVVRRQQKKKVAKYLQKIYETERGLHGVEPEQEPNLNDIPEYIVISSSELAGMDFETIGLKGKYRELIGDPSVGFSAMVFGLPKSGKSTLCIDFAKYLAENHGKVLYVAIEEGFGYTLKEKFERLGAIHPNLVIAEKIPDDLTPYQFVFIDSVSKAGLSNADLTRLRKNNPKTAFVFIFHTTKEGNFRGKQDFAHDVDVIIEVENGEAKANGRFGIGGRIEVF